MKWIIHLNVKDKVIKFLEENIVEYGVGKDFLNQNPKDTNQKKKKNNNNNNKVNFKKIKNFCSSKDTIKIVKR